jgi:acetyl esterase/lipase
MALDDATAAFVARTESEWRRPLHQMSVAEARALGHASAVGQPRALGQGSGARDTLVTSVGGTIAARVFVPEADPRGVIVFYHPGGWALGGVVDAQVLLCPVTDADVGSLSATDPANQLLVGRDAMTWFWDMYAPDAAARRKRFAGQMHGFTGVLSLPGSADSLDFIAAALGRSVWQREIGEKLAALV